MGNPSNPLDWAKYAEQAWEAAKESSEIASPSASLHTRFWG